MAIKLTHFFRGRKDLKGLIWLLTEMAVIWGAGLLCCKSRIRMWFKNIKSPQPAKNGGWVGWTRPFVIYPFLHMHTCWLVGGWDIPSQATKRNQNYKRGCDNIRSKVNHCIRQRMCHRPKTRVTIMVTVKEQQARPIMYKEPCSSNCSLI